MTGYRSIFLEPDWAHALYYGWRDEGAADGIRTLSKRNGPLRRSLLLSSATDSRAVAEALVRERRRLGPLGEIIVHDFSGVLPDAAPRLDLEPLARDKLLNTATFVIDLARPEEDLLAAMSADTRRRIRKAERDGIQVRVDTAPDPDLIGRFVAMHGRMAGERGLKELSAATIAAMIADGRSALLSTSEGGENGSFLLTYRAGDKAIWLHGVGRGASSDAGQLIQWRAMQMLRTQGVRWYDLGGVPSLDQNNGLYRFKKSFGGELVDLGGEYRFRTPLARLARLVFAGARRLRRAGGA